MPVYHVAQGLFKKRYRPQARYPNSPWAAETARQPKPAGEEKALARQIIRDTVNTEAGIQKLPYFKGFLAGEPAQRKAKVA
jgi:hypothetical protein